MQEIEFFLREKLNNDIKEHIFCYLVYHPFCFTIEDKNYRLDCRASQILFKKLLINTLTSKSVYIRQYTKILFALKRTKFYCSIIEDLINAYYDATMEPIY